MKPTNKLRFVERVIPSPELPTNMETKVKILQQWWDGTPTINLSWTGDIPVCEPVGEWRDVPIEKEQA